MKAQILGVDCFVADQTIGFQGNHINKLHITYKVEGGGFQCDSLCLDRYTFTHNQPEPNIYVQTLVYPLYTLVFYHCLIVFSKIFTGVEWITSTCH